MEQLTFLNCLIYDEFSFFSEVVYVTIGNPALCLALYLAGVHFRSKLQHVGDNNFCDYYITEIITTPDADMQFR